MFSWLLPNERNFFDYFSQHAAIAVLAAEELKNNHRTRKIEELEGQADIITHRCIEALSNTFITPIDRHDIFRLISRMDDIVDHIDATARSCVIYQMEEPTPQFRSLTELLIQAVRALEIAIKGLHNLRNPKSIEEHCIVVNTIENEADIVLANALKTLYEKEPDVRLILKWKEIYEGVGKAIDRCEEVANIIEGIVLEHI